MKETVRVVGKIFAGIYKEGPMFLFAILVIFPLIAGQEIVKRLRDKA